MSYSKKGLIKANTMSGNAWSNAPVEQRRMVLIIVAFFIILFVLGILTQPKPSAPTIVPSPTLTPSLNSVQLGSLVKPICDGIGINTMNIYSNISGIHPIISSNPDHIIFPKNGAQPILILLNLYYVLIIKLKFMWMIAGHIPMALEEILRFLVMTLSQIIFYVKLILE